MRALFIFSFTARAICEISSGDPAASQPHSSDGGSGLPEGALRPISDMETTTGSEVELRPDDMIEAYYNGYNPSEIGFASGELPLGVCYLSD